MSARSLYPPAQSGQRILELGVMEPENTFEKTDDPTASYPVRKRACIPRKPMIEFHRDRASVS